MTNDWEQRAGKQHHKARRSLKAPLCKGSCHANSVTEGLPQRAVANSPQSGANTSSSPAQSLRQKSKIFDTSLYTREAWRSRASMIFLI